MTESAAVNLTAEQYRKIYVSMSPVVRDKIATAFMRAIGDGYDIYDPATGTSPAGENVMTWANAYAARLGFSPEATSMLRWNVRAIGRELIKAAFS